VLSPPGSRDLGHYYAAVREAAGEVPLLGYHFPASSSPGIPLDALAGLPIDGCKDSSGDPGRMLLTLASFDRPLYVGSDALLALAGPVGCAGAILALANAEPERCVAAFSGDAAAQRSLAEPHRRTSGRFPQGIKELTAERFGTSPAVRLG
jgi:dihydrodipicolinate synthase/N-acetylneuraminate lyase